MLSGLTPQLMLMAFIIGLAGLLILRRFLPLDAAIVITLIKVAVPTVYFANFFDGSWTLLDDISYFHAGKDLVQSGYSPWNIWFDPVGILKLVAVSQGDHILYYWFNFMAQYLFGEVYAAPVFINVLLTFIAGAAFYRIVQFSGFGDLYARWALAFFLLHWEVLTWSSFLNLKDVFVMCLSVLAFYYILALVQAITIARVIGLAVVLFLFLWIRFYIPILIGGVTGIWFTVALSGRKRFILFLIAVLALVGVIMRSGVGGILADIELLNIAGLLAGVVRMILTPEPWSIDRSYSFLLLPSILNWFLALPAIYGGVHLWKRSRNATLLIMYLVFTLCLYGSFGELQGPRHRVQLLFIIAWLQFHACFTILRQICSPFQNLMAKDHNSLT